MLPRESVYLIFFFFFAYCPSSPPVLFYIRCVAHSLLLALSSYLGCLPLLVPFVNSLLRRMFSLPYACYVCLPFVCFPFVFCLSVLNPFLATMSFAGYFHVRFLLSAFPVFLFQPCSFSVCFVLGPSIL